MLNKIYATKKSSTQAWDQAGKRIPVTIVAYDSSYTVTQVKKTDTDGYAALQVGFGHKRPKNLSKPLLGHLKSAQTNVTPRYLKEIRVAKSEELESYQLGQTLDPIEGFAVGDRVKVIGKSRGRGFAGVVKRHGFAGGPRTHGQSDRERAPGSIGQGTTPGRVYKGKRMAGRYGNQQFTVRNLILVHIDSATHQLWLKGTVPGTTTSLLTIVKTGTTSFPGLMVDATTTSTPTAAPAETEAASQDQSETEATETKPETDQVADIKK